jgi:PAS domain S-box-containing protein
MIIASQQNDIAHTLPRSWRGLSIVSLPLVLLVGLIVSFSAWRIAVHFDERVVEAQFDALATRHALAIQKQFETSASALQELASLYAVNDAVTGDQFSRFAAPIVDRASALEALSWSPAAPRELPVVIAYVEPPDSAEFLRGLDLGSQPARQQALELARDTGSLSIAAPLAPTQTPQQSGRALALLPRYRPGAPMGTVEERRANLEGYFVAVVNIDLAIAAAFSSQDRADIELMVVATAPSGAAAQWYSSMRPMGGDPIAASPARIDGDDNRPDYAFTFPWGGHAIDLRLVATEANLAAAKTHLPSGVLLAALSLTGLAMLMVYLVRNRTLRIAREAAERTKELRETNDDLRAEVDRRIEVERQLEAHGEDLEKIVAQRTSKQRAASAQLRTILESEPECVKILSSEGQLLDMNAAGLAMIEADSLQQVRGCNVFGLIAEQHRDAFIELNRRVIAGEPGTLEFKINGLRGGSRWLETNAVPFVDPEDGVTKHLAITRDITAKKASLREKKILEAQLRHAQKLESIGVLAGGIAHDFNNLLQVIMGNSEMALKDMSIDASARDRIEASYAAATSAASLCDQMLTYAGHSRQDFQSIHLPQLVESMVNLLKVSYSKSAEFVFNFDKGAGAIEGDDAQIRQVLMNLVTNASESLDNDPGRIALNIGTADIAAVSAASNWVGPVPPAGQYVSLEVSDTGCGMDTQTRDKIFDPFFTTKFTGRGLGLSATLGIIRSHHGFLKVDSVAGQGTSFTVLFPVATPSQKAATTPAAREPGMLDATVLLADDEKAVRKVSCAMLEQLGCRVILAANGREAVEKFTENADDIDIVLMDLAMPRLNGNEACAQIRRIRPDIPVIFCSGYANDAVEADVAAAGFTGFLHKPYRRHQLIRMLQEGLRPGDGRRLRAREMSAT